MRTATQAEQTGILYLIEILIALNIALGLLNMLPMLPLDGGHVAIAVYERIRTRRGQPYYQADVKKLLPVVYAFSPRSWWWWWRPSTSTSSTRWPTPSADRPRRPARRDGPAAGTAEWAAMEPSADLLWPRRPTRRIHVGSVAVGGGAPVSVQSMTTTKTADVEGTLAQVYELAAAGADIVRCTCNEAAAAEGLAQIVPRSPVPIVADIHFHHEMAFAALEAGVQGLRLNPGNLRKETEIKQVAAEAKDRGVPIRIGVNAGSLHPDLYKRHGGATPEALVESARMELAYFDEVGFDDVKISVKASSVALMIAAYRLAVGDLRPPAAPRGDRGRPAPGRAS